MSRERAAIYTATAVQVDCPHCGETLPDPTGSFFWTLAELSLAIAQQAERVCDGCEESFVLRQQSRCVLPLGRPDQPEVVDG